MKKKSDGVEGITPRNFEQEALLETLLDEDIRIVGALGRAGTGKTLLSLAAGLRLVSKGDYHNVTVIRPTTVSGEDVGYLPGDIGDKIGPHFGAIEDVLLCILGDAAKDEAVNGGEVDYLTITHIRGRTLTNSFVIVDDAQNLRDSDLKLIGTRIGTGSKLVLAGDPFQSDLPEISDERDIALTKAVDRQRRITDSRKRDVFNYVLLKDVERGLIAEIFSEIF
ncbi:AAA family ATPase [Candidatus Woesearchaeota archaeon]|nr:AAA family ATPase [Candidatus Woesearchaeota archaeon]MBT5397149.1 AAA family ATPase [Candidatus Woesearchaeota archaeon]MBT5924466.1 AAA family ATPase [Candidatus Woesearchaeota archaeon]MBT6367305.1 AAA family ATPase [Candidatus Woesearchaeota archaeon]MBT7762549.1 AAA family ATPase [Candidatus Woesearchaeota archaeon]